MLVRVSTLFAILVFVLGGCLADSTTSPELASSDLAVEEGDECDDPNVIALIGATSYATIQDAIDVAVTGDTVEICPGTHTEQLSVPPGLQVTLASWSGDALDTELDGAGTGTILYTRPMSEVTLADLTFLNGWAPVNGGAVYAMSQRLEVQRCRFIDNSAGQNGGAISVNSTVGGIPGPWDVIIELEDSTFEGNFAGYGGGAINAAANTPSLLAISGSTFRDNETTYEGGAITCGTWDLMTLELFDSTFSNNVTGYGGGAVAVASWSNTQTWIEGCHFQSNLAGYEGGAVSLGSWDIGDHRLIDCTFDSNYSNHEGGALKLGTWEAARMFLQRCTFTDNTAESTSGAIDVGSWAWYYRIVLDEVTFDSNTVNNGSNAGGALYVSSRPEDVDMTIHDSTVIRNDSGFYLNDDTQLDSVNTDWGSGLTDNLAYDVDTGTNTYGIWGAGASFTCLGGGICW